MRKISNVTFPLFLMFLLGNSLFLSEKAYSFEPVCPEFTMEIQCQKLIELEERNQYHRQLGIIPPSAYFKKKQKYYKK